MHTDQSSWLECQAGTAARWLRGQARGAGGEAKDDCSPKLWATSRPWPHPSAPCLWPGSQLDWFVCISYRRRGSMKTLAACHRRTAKHPAPTMCGYCVRIFILQMQKQKQKQKHRKVEFTAEISAAFVETKAQMRATADNKMLR